MILTTGNPKPKTNNSGEHYFSGLSLKRDPFSTSPDPYYFFPTRQHQASLSRLEISVRLRRGANLVLGEIGTGKTTLCRTLIQNLKTDPSIEIHLLLNPSEESEADFLKNLSGIFHVTPPSPSSFDMTHSLKDFLFLKGVEENKTILLIIDEAQKLSMAALEVLRTLLNYETNEYKLLQLVLFSQLQLKEKLKLMPNFVDRLNTKLELKSLSLLECTRLIHFRLLKAGYPNKGRALFLPSAIRAIHEITGGYPRKIGLLCHKILEHLTLFQGVQANEMLVKRISNGENALL